MPLRSIIIFVDILELSRMVKSESSAFRLLKSLRWPKGVNCSRCKSKSIISIRRKRYLCLNCKCELSLFSGTYLSSNKIPLPKLILAVKLFVLGLSALETAKELRLNYRTVLSLFDTIRLSIYHHNTETKMHLSGEVEIEETYIGGKRKGKRSRGAAHKIPAFGMIGRDGKVIVEVIPNVESETLRNIVRQNVKEGSKIYSDRFKSYASLIINGYEHIKVDKEKRFANGKTHINTIESFWAYAKENLAKFHGLKPEKLPFYLKELEFRFNI